MDGWNVHGHNPILYLTDTCGGDAFPEELLLHLLQTHKERKFQEVVD